jgi:DNA-directed RNA polymerase subunit omega
MARVTVEDCVRIVPNRFELVVLASQRAKEITSGAPITVERDNDKNAVISLREIANNNINPVVLRESVVKGMQRKNRFDENDMISEGVSDVDEDMITMEVGTGLSIMDEDSEDFEGGMDIGEDGGDYSFEDEADIDEE